jgi:hypothetical protein
MSELDTAEYRKLALIAAGVPLNQIPPIIDTATWRRMLIAALVNSTANQVISGSVDYFSQLPTTIGSPAIGATWLVRNSSGIFYINYRSAGVYMKVTDTGSASDWVYIPMSAIGTLPDVNLTNQQVGDTLTWDGTRWVNSTTTSVTSFTTVGTFAFTISSNTKSIDVVCIGGGGGGGGGTRTGTGPQAAYGGSGGGGGGLSMYSFRMPSSSNLICTIIVGRGGSGGVVGGGSAQSGGTSSFTASNGVSVLAGGGVFGLNGSASIPSNSSSGGTAMFPGGGGLFYNSSIPAPSAGAGGGGSGGGANSFGQQLPRSLGSSPTSVTGQSSISGDNIYPGSGGGGGSGSVSGLPANGSNGASYGGGGGGGGSTISGVGGTYQGGSGASGAVVVIQHF